MKSAAVIAELRRISRANGGLLRPEDVVEAARPVNAPLHGKFTWDDGRAAEKYRIYEARQLIRVSVEFLPAIQKSYDVFVSLGPDRSKDGGGYREVLAVLGNPSRRAQMLEDAVHELHVFKEKYQALSELAAVFSAIKKVTKKK